MLAQRGTTPHNLLARLLTDRSFPPLKYDIYLVHGSMTSLQKAAAGPCLNGLLRTLAFLASPVPRRPHLAGSATSASFCRHISSVGDNDNDRSTHGSSVPEGDELTASDVAQPHDSRITPDISGRPVFLFNEDTAAIPVAPSVHDAKPAASTSFAQQEAHEHLSPVPFHLIPEHLRPHFRPTTKKRPDPMAIRDIWDAVRAADKVSKRAQANGFVPSVDVSFSLFIDPRKSDQLIRGSVALPHGTGKDKRVAVFAQGADQALAQEAGAAIVGGEELVAEVAERKGIDADIVIATPDMMPKLGKVARILGPKGLMPNPKMGTVTNSVREAVAQMKRGKVQFRNDKGGTVSCSIGRKTFSDEQLRDNFYAVLDAIMELRPRSVKGADIKGYIERVCVSTTQGRGFPVRAEDLNLAARSAAATR